MDWRRREGRWTCSPDGPTRCGPVRPAPTAPRGLRVTDTSRPPRSSTPSCSSRTSGATSRRRHEGDVHVRGQGRPLGHPASRGDAPVMRAYLDHAGPASPFKGLLRRHASSRTGGPRPGRYREFRQFGVEVIGVGEPGRRRRGLRGRGPVPAGPGPRRSRAPGELDRRRGVPAGVPRGADRARHVPAAAHTATDSTRLPRAPSRGTRCGSSTARSTAGKESCEPPSIADRLCDAVRDALRGRARGARRGRAAAGGCLLARPHARAGARLLHAHGVRVVVRRAAGEQGRHGERRWSLRRLSPRRSEG